MPLFDHFSFLAPIYEIFFPPPDDDRWRRVLQLPVDGPLLDAGGGTGRVTSQFAEQVSTVIVLDPSWGMLTRAGQRQGVAPVQAQAEHLPFGDETMARIVIVDALHHLIDTRQALREFMRVLIPDGRLVIEEPDWRRPLMRLVALGEKLILMRSHPHMPEEILSMARAVGARAHCVRAENASVWVVIEKADERGPMQAGG